MPVKIRRLDSDSRDPCAIRLGNHQWLDRKAANRGHCDRETTRQPAALRQPRTYRSLREMLRCKLKQLLAPRSAADRKRRVAARAGKIRWNQPAGERPLSKSAL